MITLGITGGMGMGKSTIMQMLHDKGIPTQSADTIVHELLAQGGAGVPLVRPVFPESFVNGAIDRRILGKVLFNDAQIKSLERLLHPLVFDAITSFKQDMQAQGQAVIAIDVPLLFETEIEYEFDAVLCVSTSAALQKERCLTRPHMTPEKFAAIVSRQMPDSEKRELADHVIDNNGTIAQTQQQLDDILATILKQKG